MKYKLVIFDFDGTLADSFPWVLHIANTLADAYRFKRIEADEVEGLRGYGAAHLIKHLGIPLWKLPLVARRARTLMAQNIDQIAPFAGVEEMLEQLAAHGVRLALVTSNSQDNVSKVLGAENMARISHFECNVALFGKRQRFRKLLALSGVQPHETLCIGDELRDAEAARKAGLPFGAVAWGFTKLDALQAFGPTEVFRSVDEIVATIG